MEKRKSFFKRQKRVRGSIAKNLTRVRLAVHRSNKHIYAQLIDNKKGATLVSVGDLGKETKGKKLGKAESAFSVGEKIAERAIKKGIKTVAFDRSGYKYHGRIKAVAEGARKGGLNF
jgi:large subunit ribosomal protein L18